MIHHTHTHTTYNTHTTATPYSLLQSLASWSYCSPACWVLPLALRGQQDPRGGVHLVGPHDVLETSLWHLVSQQVDDRIFASRWDPQRGGPTQLSALGTAINCSLRLLRGHSRKILASALRKCCLFCSAPFSAEVSGPLFRLTFGPTREQNSWPPPGLGQPRKTLAL